MRNIKFRGKIKDKKRAKELGLKVGDWVYGYFFHDEGLTFYNGKTKRFDKYYIINTPYIEEYIEIIPETIGQYTGLKDRNMKEIYEGDVVQALFYDQEETKIQGVVAYVEAAACYMVIANNGDEWELGYLDEIEKTGNKWDNPELLKEGE